MPTYECFLGALASTEEIFIKEAGEHCRRDIDPYRYSMQLNKTKACPRMKTNMNVHSSHEHDDKLAFTSTSTMATIETTLSNSEVEYEYFDENHSNLNGNSNVLSSTESKVNHVSEKTGTVDELYHPVHPKLDIDIPPKIDNKNNTSHSNSNSNQNDRHLLALLLPLVLILPILIY